MCYWITLEKRNTPWLETCILKTANTTHDCWVKYNSSMHDIIGPLEGLLAASSTWKKNSKEIVAKPVLWI